VGRGRGHIDRGREAEAFVATGLEQAGYRVIARNVRVGRLELDLLARRGNLLVVVEVRARAAGGPGTPAETIGPRKIGRIRRATARWLSEQSGYGGPVRFDVASVVFDGPGASPRLDHYYEDAF
jgi:putative endonuclease